MKEFLLQEFAGLMIYGSQALVLYFAIRKLAILYAAKQLEKRFTNSVVKPGGFGDTRNERAS